MSRIALASVALALCFDSPVFAQPAKGTGFADKPTQEQLAFFEKKIRPVLVESCYKCHSAESEKVKGELLLDTRDGIRKGGTSGPSIIAGNPDRSPLIKGMRHKDPDTAMPPKEKLPDAVVADFEAWVKMGAPDPREGKAVANNKYVVDVEKGRSFWAFVAPKKAPAPEVKNAAWATSSIDRHILADLEKNGIKPVGNADKRTLLRRIYLDLTGLPPTSEEMEAFVADAAPNAFEKVVDKLLASPRFGERWGRHWLDIARYAESSGKTANFNYPHAWRYRDYVIGAFNSDKPYDQFIKEQLAGDLMPSADPKTKAERIVATGFLAIGPKALNENSSLQFELDIVDEQIDVTTQAFLGITAACARCHDHKFDPIPTKDYYALAGIFRSTETCYGTVRFVQSQRPSPLIALPAESAPCAIGKKLTAEERTALEKEIADLKKKIAESTDRLANIFPAAQLAAAQSKLDTYEADGTPKLQAMGARDKPERGGGFPPPKGPFGPGGFGPKGGFGMSRSIDDSPIYTRGEPNQPTETKVPRGTLQVMSKTPLKIRSGSGRLELAQWIASKDNPLTARVMANRVWMHLFGRGIVSTAENFGAAGQPPSNPELLDHLAISFMDDAWSVKKLVKRIRDESRVSARLEVRQGGVRSGPGKRPDLANVATTARRRESAGFDARGERSARRNAPGGVGGGTCGRRPDAATAARWRRHRAGNQRPEEHAPFGVHADRPRQPAGSAGPVRRSGPEPYHGRPPDDNGSLAGAVHPEQSVRDSLVGNGCRQTNEVHDDRNGTDSCRVSDVLRSHAGREGAGRRREVPGRVPGTTGQGPHFPAASGTRDVGGVLPGVVRERRIPVSQVTNVRRSRRCT